MSIRIRQSNDLTIALCAAETDELPGDVYLDDAQHYALAAKFASDWQGGRVDWSYPEEWAEMAKHKVRDAVEELNRWLSIVGEGQG
jgi:hypothetical protein